MKQAFPVLKMLILMLPLMAETNLLSAQNCYRTFIEEGVQAFNAFQFETAIKKFEAAKVCADKPDSVEADEWLAKAQNGYIDRLQLIASRFLTSEGQRAFQQKNYKAAFRLYQEALKYKSDNAQAKKLQEQMLSYLADYQYKAEIDPRFYNPKQVALTGSGSLVVLDKDPAKSATLIQLIDPGSRALKQVFSIEGSLSDYQFSKDGKWLAVEFYDQNEKKVKLSLWNVFSGQLIKTFSEIYRSEAYKAFTFSNNGQKLVYRKAEIIKRTSLKTNDEGDLVTDTLTHPGYSLNIYDLVAQKAIYNTGTIADYFIESENAIFGGFRRESTSQNLINEKIALKFSTEGVITTNNENFVLKENEFRIRRDYDFAISPDGKKFAYHQYGEEEQIEIDFNTEVKITFEPTPKTLIGTITAVNLEDGNILFSSKSDYQELPQQFLPFGFSKNSKHLVFINSRKWTGLEYDNETAKWESTNTVFKTGFNVFNFEKDTFFIENEQSVYDYFVTENNLLVTWSGSEMFAMKKGKFNVCHLDFDTLVFSADLINDFSHFYDVVAENDSLFFSTFDENSLKTTLYVLNVKRGVSTALNFGFADFKYTYARVSSDRSKIAFLKDNGLTISVWDLKNQRQIREIKCQDRIAEFDFSEDSNFMIIRDKTYLLKIIDLRITENLYNYFDKYLDQLTAGEKAEIGIDW